MYIIYTSDPGTDEPKVYWHTVFHWQGREDAAELFSLERAISEMVNLTALLEPGQHLGVKCV